MPTLSRVGHFTVSSVRRREIPNDHRYPNTRNGTENERNIASFDSYVTGLVIFTTEPLLLYDDAKYVQRKINRSGTGTCQVSAIRLQIVNCCTTQDDANISSACLMGLREWLSDISLPFWRRAHGRGHAYCGNHLGSKCIGGLHTIKGVHYGPSAL